MAQAIAIMVALVTGYLVGFQHGGDRARLAGSAAAVEIPVPVASPHESVCAVMLEAAWSIKDVPPTR